MVTRSFSTETLHTSIQNTYNIVGNNPQEKEVISIKWQT